MKANYAGAGPPTTIDPANLANLFGQVPATQNMLAATTFMLPAMFCMQVNSNVRHIVNAPPLIQAPVAPPARTLSPAPPTATITKQFTMSLTDFCLRYSISERDRIWLEKLEFEIGDDTALEGLSREDWGEGPNGAGFTSLA